MPSRPLLSACLIVRDEEACLARCIESLRGIVDEIVVVDTGSTDRTVEIASGYGAKVHSFAWQDDFAAARNRSLSAAAGVWALWIDADEELSLKDAAALRGRLSREDIGGFDLEIINFTEDEGDRGQFVHWATRIFRLLPGVEFTGRVHEQITPSLAALGLHWEPLSCAGIRHYGYRPAQMRAKNKIQRTVALLEADVAEHPADSHQWFNLANAYLVAGRYKEAEAAAESCLRQVDGFAPYVGVCYQILSSARMATGDLDGALEACAGADANGWNGPVNEFERACALSRLGRFGEAIGACSLCRELAFRDGEPGDRTVQTHKSVVLEANCHLALGEAAKAREAVQMLFESDPGYVPAALAFAQASERHGDFQAAGRAFELAWQSEPGLTDAWVGWARCCEASGDSKGMLRAFEHYGKLAEPTADMLIDWGRALAASGANERALECFGEAIKREPSNANAYFNCGDLLYGLGAYPDAAHIYEAGLRHSPGYAQGWFTLGNCLAQMSLSGGASTCYRQALEIDPAHEAARHNLGLVAA